MASTAGGSGAGWGDRCPSGEKGSTPVDRRCKKPSAFHRAALRYLEKEYRKYVARGEEPPFDLEDLLRPGVPGWKTGTKMVSQSGQIACSVVVSSLHKTIIRSIIPD